MSKTNSFSIGLNAFFCRAFLSRGLAEYTGPISNRLGFVAMTWALSAEWVAKERYRRYTSFCKVNASSRFVKALPGLGEWFNHSKR